MPVHENPPIWKTNPDALYRWARSEGLDWRTAYNAATRPEDADWIVRHLDALQDVDGIAASKLEDCDQCGHCDLCEIYLPHVDAFDEWTLEVVAQACDAHDFENGPLWIEVNRLPVPFYRPAWYHEPETRRHDAVLATRRKHGVQ